MFTVFKLILVRSVDRSSPGAEAWAKALLIDDDISAPRVHRARPSRPSAPAGRGCDVGMGLKQGQPRYSGVDPQPHVKNWPMFLSVTQSLRSKRTKPN